MELVGELRRICLAQAVRLAHAGELSIRPLLAYSGELSKWLLLSGHTERLLSEGLLSECLLPEAQSLTPGLLS
jgi:hypothetical protein